MSNSHVLVGSVPQTAGGRLSTSLLTRNDSLTTNNLGGKFALPTEFDTGKYVGGIYEEGQEARSMEGPQALIGVGYTAPGWSIWTYPKLKATGKLDGKGQQIMEEHPLAGKPHKISGTKPGENYVLMFRSKGVQDQVNGVYGALSTEQMVSEILGETQGATQGDNGILTNARLNAEIGVDRAVEEEIRSGTSTVVAGQINRPAQRVSR